MQQNQPSWIQYLILFTVITVLIAIALTYRPDVDKTDYNKVRQIVQAEMSNIPSVEVTTTEINETAFTNAFRTILEETGVNKADEQKIDESWKKTYSDEITVLELKAANKVLEEFDGVNISDIDGFEGNLSVSTDFEDEIEDFLKGEIENFDTLEDIEINEDKTKINIINLGLDNEDDTKVEIILEVKVWYELDYSSDETKDIVFIKANYYVDDGDEELKVSYSL